MKPDWFPATSLVVVVLRFSERESFEAQRAWVVLLEVMRDFNWFGLGRVRNGDKEAIGELSLKECFFCQIWFSNDYI